MEALHSLASPKEEREALVLVQWASSELVSYLLVPELNIMQMLILL